MLTDDRSTEASELGLPKVRADELRTKREVAAAFFAAGSPRTICFVFALAVVVRLALGNWSIADAAVVLVSLGLVGLVEWAIHLLLLHASPTSFRMRVLKTGTGHQQHHLDPPELRWLLLCWVDAALFSVLIAAFTVLWTIPLALLAGAPSVPAVIATGVVAAYLLLGHYEWTHLLVHTRYRPKTRYYRRLARNHRLHHYRNERYWLGVTSNLGDRVLRSYPAEKTDVALSPTARTLTD